MDDRKGVVVARGKGLRVTGTLGILDIAAQRGLINFTEAIARLRRTTFRIPEAVLDSLMKRHAGDGGNPYIHSRKTHLIAQGRQFYKAHPSWAWYVRGDTQWVPPNGERKL